jgi:DNA-binding HxlR family transcriptional regulator
LVYSRVSCNKAHCCGVVSIRIPGMRRSLPRAKPHPKCPVELALDIVGGRWKAIVLFHLLTNPLLRFNELRRRLPGATQRMLTLQLRELERSGCIERKVYPEVPPRVEYSLTPFGRTLEPVVDALCSWGLTHGGWAPPVAAESAAG